MGDRIGESASPADTTWTVPESTSALPSPVATTAVALGWQMAEFYRDATKEKISQSTWAGWEKLPADLPGASSLRLRYLFRMRLAQIETAVVKLSALASSKAGPLASTSQLAGLIDSDTPPARDDLGRAVLDLHVELVTALTACDFRLGKAYGLGRATADFCLRPTCTTREGLVADFGRRFTLSRWLGELKTLLPDHAAEAVSTSIGLWNEWITRDAPTSITSDAAKDIRGHLHAQGRIWRTLLTGEKAGRDFLGATAMAKAGGALLMRIRSLVWQFVRQFWVALAAIGILVASLVVAAVVLASAGARFAAILASALSGLGLTWKTVSATLGRAARQTEDGLWSAELDLAIADAATVLPAGTTTALIVPSARIGGIRPGGSISAPHIAVRPLPPPDHAAPTRRPKRRRRKTYPEAQVQDREPVKEERIGD